MPQRLFSDKDDNNYSCLTLRKCHISCTKYQRIPLPFYILVGFLALIPLLKHISPYLLRTDVPFDLVDNKTTLNLSVRFIIEPRIRNQLDLLVMVNSIPNQYRERQEIRNSWADKALYDDQTTKIIFIIGRPMILLFIALHFQFAISFLIPQWKELEENVEKVAELSKEHEERYIISLSNPNNPVFMYLTPCGAIVHWRLYRVKSDLTDISLTQPFTDLSNFELIAGEADDRRMKFFSHHVNAAAIDDFYPPLPHDLRVARAISRQDNSDLNQALVTWKVSDGVRNAERNRYRFCAVVSRRYPDWAVCDQLDEGLESIHCISQSNNSIVVKNLRSGKRYFITVFVRDSLHGSTSSYDSLEVNLKKATEIDNVNIKKEEVHPLLDAVLQAGSLPARKSATVDYQFVLPSNSSKNQRVLLIVHACDGYVRMSVFRNGRLLKRSEPFSGFRRFLVLNVRSGQLRFQISNDDYRAKSIRMWASVRPDKSPYPMLPEDTSRNNMYIYIYIYIYIYY
uniref:Fibronectin type-III domain-containing protein n=1 Tax=Heterorhabditis bacteriophora TaxID=37862 RepID=A0A1I7XJP1_HETBA